MAQRKATKTGACQGRSNAGCFHKNILPVKDTLEHWMDMGLSLFDADNDGDLDLYIARGGYEANPASGLYRDQLWINNGKGDFVKDSTALPNVNGSKSCVRPF